MSQWYYQLFGEEFGPVSGDGLRTLIEDGTLSATDSVRRAESAEWIPAGTAGSQLDDESEVASDLSDLSFEFEESGPSTRKNAYGRQSPEVSVPAVSGGGSVVDDEELEELLYYFQVVGQTLGPVSLDVLIRKAEAGELSEQDLVRSEEDEAWQPASDIHELSVAFLLRAMPEDSVTDSPSKSSRGDKPATGGIENPAVSAARLAEAKRKADAAGAKPARPKKKKKPSTAVKKAAEDALVNDIMSEVFSAEEAAPATRRPSLSGSVGATTAAADAAGPAAAAAPVRQDAPVRQEAPVAPPTYSSSSAAPAAVSKPYTPPPRPKAKKSSGGGFQLEFGTPAKVVLGIVVAVALWFVSGPVLKVFKPETDRYVKRMELAVQTLDALNPKTQAVSYKGQLQSIGREFGAYAKVMEEAGSSSESAKNCLGALNKLVELSKMDMKELDKHKQLIEDARGFLKAYRN